MRSALQNTHAPSCSYSVPHASAQQDYLQRRYSSLLAFVPAAQALHAVYAELFTCVPTDFIETTAVLGHSLYGSAGNNQLQLPALSPTLLP